MNHEFFADIDWDALKLKKVKPPYNPRVKSNADVKHIDQKYLEENIISYTIDDTDLKKGHMKHENFEGFTYTKDETLKQSARKTFHYNS